MAGPEAIGNSIDIVSESPDVKSIIPQLGVPSMVAGRYVLDMRLNLSTPEDPYWQAEVTVTDNPEEVQKAFVATASKLAWIGFFAKPEITIAHSTEALQNGDHYPGLHTNIEQQTLTGRRFEVGENHYVVNYDPNTGVEIKTHSQLVEEGELTPYMEEWLGRILSGRNNIHPHHTDVQPFARWLRAKTPDNDFSGYYFMQR